MANVPPSTSRPLSAPSILRSLEVYESSSDSDSERSEDYVTAEDPESTDYDEDLEDLVSAMSQVTTAEVSPGRLAVVSTSGSAPASPSRPGPSRPLDPDRRTNPTVQTTFKRRSLYPSLDDVPSPFPSQPYLSTLNASGKMYLVETREGSSHRVDHWAEAGHLSQGQPGAKVQGIRVRPSKKKKKPKARAYRVIVGWETGVFLFWEDAEIAVLYCPSNQYEGHRSLEDAHIHYADDVNCGRVRKNPFYTGSKPLPTPIPTPSNLPPPPTSSRTHYVVTKGKKPGVYPSWSQAAAQVINVSRAVYVMYEGRENAENAYSLALRQGFVEVLS